MRKIQILGVFIVVLAFSALTVASATATLWLKNGVSVTKEEAADTHGELLLHHTGGLTGGYLLKCTGLFHGAVGPGALDLVTGILGLSSSTENNLITCFFTATGGCGNAVGEEDVVHPIHLPWHTLLELKNGVTVDHFQAEAGKVPGYELGCPKIFGFKGTCEGLDESQFLSNGPNGAIFHFLGVVKSTCSDGGEGFVLGLGEVLGYQDS